VLQAVINEMQTEHTVTVAWLTENTDKNNNLKCKLSNNLVWCLHRKIIHSEEGITKIIGYTRAIVTSNSSNKRTNLLFSSMLPRRRFVQLGNGTF
jgi:hypothetical protein